MRHSLVRDVNLILPMLAVLAMGVLAGMGWQRSVAIQRSREATAVIGDEARLLEPVGQTLRESGRAELDYLLRGEAPDLTASQAAARRIDALCARLAADARRDPVHGPALATLVELVGVRQAALAHELALRVGLPPLPRVSGRQAVSVQAAGTQAEDDKVLDRLAAAGQVLERSREEHLDSVTREIRAVRWLAVAVALMGVLSVLSVFRLLRRAWRRLSRAETEQRELALQLRSSLDSLSQGVAVFGGDGQLLNWNMRLRQMLDLPAALLRPGLSYGALERQLAADGAALLEPLRLVLSPAPVADGMRPRVHEAAVRRHDGAGESQIEIRRTLMPEGGFVLTLTDISERVQAERMLREAQKMQALGQLTGGIAHDFNNMLTVVLGSLDVPPAELADAGDRQAAMLAARMRRAARAAEGGAALTHRLLSFARKQPLEPEPVDLGSVLPELMPLLRQTIGEGIEVRLEAEPGPWPVLADAAQLESAVLNLALNARDAMPGGGRLTITAGNTAIGAMEAAAHPDLAPGEYVRLSVTDTGCGMSQEVMAQAFEPFFTTKPEGRGTGLGLAMVLGFARQSGGAVTIRSETSPGAARGTTIAIHLPRTSRAAADQVAAAAPPAAPSAGASRARILLVEDNAAVREITAEMLRELGYRVSEAREAEQALALLDAHDADAHHGAVALLLTDIVLPGALDGRALAARVRQHSPHTRVLYMSGNLEGAPLPDAAEPEAMHWLGKPFRRAQLAAKVDALIGVGRASRAA